MPKRAFNPSDWFGPDARASLIPLITLAMLTALLLRLSSDSESSITLEPAALDQSGLKENTDNQLGELPLFEEIASELAPASITLEEIHDQNAEGFARAEGFGRHRGGSHILLDDGAVRFITDSTMTNQGVESANQTSSQTSVYGLWGSLGTRARQNDHPKLDDMANEFIDPSWLALWKLKKVELISLNRFETPVAYVDPKLPSMDQLKSSSIPTRALNQFESTAVSRILDGEKTVTNQTISSIQMVGAIQATQQCLQCHNTQVGGLLGAFSYEFTHNGND